MGEAYSGLLFSLLGLTGAFIYFAIEALIVSLGLSLYVMLATKMVAGFRPKYLKALMVTFWATLCFSFITIGLLASSIFSKVYGTVVQKTLVDDDKKSIIFLIIVLLVNGLVYSRIKSKDGKQIGFFKGFLVNLVSIGAIIFTLFMFWCVTGFPFEFFLPLLHFYA